MSELTSELKDRIAEAVRQSPPPRSLPGLFQRCGPEWMWRIVAYQNGKPVVEITRYMVVE
jgi:hypothetical protein